eukprot:COSAG02_NODE_8415_length_2579_cov_1.518952_2_plen_92_part_00
MVEGASGGSTGMENVEAGPIMRAYFCVLVVCVFFSQLTQMSAVDTGLESATSVRDFFPAFARHCCPLYSTAQANQSTINTALWRQLGGRRN